MKMSKKFSSLLICSLIVLWVLVLSPGSQAAEPKALDAGYKVVRLVKDSPLPGGCNGAVIGADGALYVVHVMTGEISRIDLKTNKLSQFVPGYGGTYITDDLTADDAGNFYVTGTTAFVGEVYRIDRNGLKTVIAKPADFEGLTAPNGIQYNKRTGRLFMSECFWANRVFELDPTGAQKPRLLVKENVIKVPEGFDFDRDTNDLIIPDMGAGKIVRVNPDTGDVKIIAEGFAAPIALKVGKDKMAYIPEIGGNVYRLSLDGQKKEKLAQLPPGLDNLAITADGRLFITSYWNATVYEVSTDGSGKFKTLFPTGPNTITGAVFKNGKLFVGDAVWVRSLEKNQFVPTKINCWSAPGLPLIEGLADGPGDQVLWPDWVTFSVGIGNPATGEIKRVADKLNLPVAVLMNPREPKFYVAEYGAGQITEVNLADGAKKTLATGLEGPVGLAIIDNMLYVAEAKPGRISKVDPATGKTEVFLTGAVGKVGALANDGEGNLLALDGASGRLFRINPKSPALSVVAENIPVRYRLVGSYPTLEIPLAMTVDAKGNIYIVTAHQGLIELERKK